MGLTGVRWQCHVRTQLRQHQASGHLPLGVGGMAIGKKFHRLDLAAGLRTLVFLVTAFLATVFLAAGA